MDRKGVPVGEGVGVPQGKEIAVSDITERMRMKVLWLCNIMIPAVAEELGLPYSNREGWLTGCYGRICGGDGGVELGICFPVEGNPAQVEERCAGKPGFRLGESGTVCYAFEERLSSPEKYDTGMEERFMEILKDFQPDLVHIFGTEFPHTLAMVRAFGRPERTLIGIQGLCYACADAYLADLPERVVRRKTFRDWLKKDGILQQQEKFRVRGEREKEALRGTGHITGRTGFDRAETGRVNPGAEYHFMNETMRSPFYEGRWEREKAEPYSIFLSQGDYPLKGFHYVLLALGEVVGEYPKARVRVAGNSIIGNRTWKEKVKISSYGKYLLELVKSLGLEGHVEVLGKLSAQEMKAVFLRSGLFVCPSSLENSPNSMGEAMLLGVPVVAARTGGIPSMIEDGREGLLYEAGNVRELAACIKRVWQEPEEAVKRAQRARIRAFDTHDGEKNYKRMLAIYREICQ